MAAGVAAVLAVASAAPAQFVGGSQRQRYERHTKGGSIDDYVKKLRSDDAEERLQAVRSLGESGDKKAIEYLLQAVGDADVRVRAKAIAMLGQMRATEATPLLIQDLFLRSTDPQMKTLILASLGKIGDARATKPVIDFLEQDLDKETRGTAIFALGDIGSPDAEEALRGIEQKETDPTLRRLASEALAKVRQRQAAQSAETNKPFENFLAKDQPPPEK